MHESSEDGPVVIRVTFDDWEKVNLRPLLGMICVDFLHPAIPVGVLELRILSFDHPPCCPEHVSWESND